MQREKGAGVSRGCDEGAADTAYPVPSSRFHRLRPG